MEERFEALLQETARLRGGHGPGNPRGFSLGFAERNEHPGPPEQAANDFALALGLRPIRSWRGVRKAEAREDLARVLVCDPMGLAGPIMNPAEADAFARRFLDLFDWGRLHILSNIGKTGGREPMTDAVDETAYFVMDERYAGLVLVSSDDR